MAVEKYASFGSFPRGCHGALPPTDIGAGYFHRGVNVTVRGGQVRTRPRLKRVASLSGTGAFKGAFVYSLDDADRLVYGRGTEVRVLNLSTLTEASVGTLSDTPRFYFAQVDRYCVIQDGVSRPLFVLEDALLRQAADYATGLPDGNEVYTGTIMAYGHGRLFLVPRHLHDLDGMPQEDKTGRPYWVAGSILTPDDPESALRFGEAQYLNGGVAAALPFESGFIQGLAFFQNAPSGTGIGPLLVFGRRGVSAVSVNVPRDAWLGADFSQVLYTGPGTRSPHSITPVNNDLVFRSLDGIRSVRLSTNTNGAAPLAVVPMSYEVSHRLELDLPEELEGVTASFADNRMLMTLGSGRGLVSMDTAPAASLGQAAAPAYEDLWTGVTFHQALAGRLDSDLPQSLVVYDEEGAPSLATVSEQETRDFGETPTQCRVYFPATAGAGPQAVTEQVKFEALHVTLRNVKGPLTVRAYYRADDYPSWSRTTSFTFTPADDRGYSFPRITFAPLNPDSGFAAGHGMTFGIGRSVQVCLEWEGVATLAGAVLQLARVTADLEMTQACSERPVCEDAEPGALVTLDDFDYEALP